MSERQEEVERMGGHNPPDPVHAYLRSVSVARKTMDAYRMKKVTMALLLGISREDLDAWLLDGKAPQYETVLRFSEVFRVSTQDLFGTRIPNRDAYQRMFRWTSMDSGIKYFPFTGTPDQVIQPGVKRR